MKPEFIFLTVIASIGVFTGILLIVTSILYKDRLDNYKQELNGDIILTIITLICLGVVIYMGIK